jgi:hypothetical protein
MKLQPPRPDINVSPQKLRLPPPRDLMSRPAILVMALAVVLSLAYGLNVRHGVALSDEYVYIVGAGYFADTGSLDARFGPRSIGAVRARERRGRRSAALDLRAAQVAVPLLQVDFGPA